MSRGNKSPCRPVRAQRRQAPRFAALDADGQSGGGRRCRASVPKPSAVSVALQKGLTASLPREQKP